MEKLTIARVGQEKEVQTKYGLKKKTGVQFKEYPDVWHDMWASGLKEGQVVEGTRESREYNGKTYWNFNLPNKAQATNTTLENHEFRIKVLESSVKQIVEEMMKGKTDNYPTEDVSGIPF